MIICQSCGRRIEPGAAYGDGKGRGPWHRLCVPQQRNTWEEKIARELKALEVGNDHGHPHLRVVK